LLFPPEKLTRFVIAPLPQKATFASAKRLQARAFYADLLTYRLFAACRLWGYRALA